MDYEDVFKLFGKIEKPNTDYGLINAFSIKDMSSNSNIIDADNHVSIPLKSEVNYMNRIIKGNSKPLIESLISSFLLVTEDDLHSFINSVIEEVMAEIGPMIADAGLDYTDVKYHMNKIGGVIVSKFIRMGLMDKLFTADPPMVVGWANYNLLLATCYYEKPYLNDI